MKWRRQQENASEKPVVYLVMQSSLVFKSRAYHDTPRNGLNNTRAEYEETF